MALKLKVPKDSELDDDNKGTYVKLKCGKFDGLRIDASAIFPRDWLVPRKADGTAEADETKKVQANFVAQIRDWDARAVVHAHPPVCIALSLTDAQLYGFLPEVTLSIGRLEVVPYARPLTDALARAVGEALTTLDAVILERHGTVAVGRDVAEAYAFTERLEHAAKVLWHAHALGAPNPLDPAEHRALEDLFGARRRSALA